LPDWGRPMMPRRMVFSCLREVNGDYSMRADSSMWRGKTFSPRRRKGREEFGK
jgi:hypothetical protein